MLKKSNIKHSTYKNNYYLKSTKWKYIRYFYEMYSDAVICLQAEDERTTYNNYCYDRKRPEEIVSQLDRALDKNYNRKNVIDFPNGREEITEVTKNGQISDNKKTRNPCKIRLSRTF